MFSRWLFAAIAAAIICLGLVSAAPVADADASNRRGDIVALNVLPLKRSAGSIQSRRGLADSAGANEKRDDGSYSWGRAALNWQNSVQDLIATVTVDGQDFNVLVDTASR